MAEKNESFAPDVPQHLRKDYKNAVGWAKDFAKEFWENLDRKRSVLCEPMKF